MCNRQQHIESARMAFGRERRVGYARVLHVERWVRLREPYAGSSMSRRFCLVVLREIDGVMRHIVVPSIDAEIHHEGRARVSSSSTASRRSSLLAQTHSAPAASSPPRNPRSPQPHPRWKRYGCAVFTPTGLAASRSARASTGSFNRISTPISAAHSCHRLALPPRTRRSDERRHARTRGTKVLKTGSGQRNGAHAKILRLEAEAEPDALVFKMGLEVAVQ